MLSDDDRVMYLSIAAIVIAVIVCVLVLVLGGCKPPIWDFDEIPDLGIQTIQDAMWWVSQNIIGVSDDIHYPRDEYWQSPAQTYIWRTGDCEDYSILVLYLIHRDVGIDGQMCTGVVYGGLHAWVYVDGHYWEPQWGQMVDNLAEFTSPAAMINYEDVIRRATTTHRRIEM